MQPSKASGQDRTSRRIELRDYQIEALERVKKAYTEGRRRVLVSLPTGTGKTVVFASFPRHFKMKRRLLVLAHREELLIQAEQKFRAIDPDLKIGIERADDYASSESQVVIASVPTLARDNGSRLSKFKPDDFSIVVVDEAHHAVADSYRVIFDHFGLFSTGTSKFLVGFTATPRRGDKQGLGEVFEEVCYARDLRQMIHAGFLCQIRGWRIDTNLSLDGVQIRHGDFVESQLARVVNVPSRNRLLPLIYRRLANYRRAIVFCVDVQHAKDVCEVFREAGIRAAAVWGDMPRDERRQILSQFSQGEISVLTNCNLLTEGFDEPRINSVIMARPTKSKLLYAQMVGRGTRLHPEKTDLMVVDVADNSKHHTIPGLHSLFNLPVSMNLEGSRALDVERDVERINRQWPWIDTSRLHRPEDIAFAATRIDFFNFDPPPELAGLTDHVWFRATDSYRLNLPDGEVLTIESNLLDSWDTRLSDSLHSRLLAQADTLTRAVAIADSFVMTDRPDAVKIVKRLADWRSGSPTEKQMEVLVRNGIPTPEGLTKGQASQILSQLFASRYRRAENKP
jgi:superfamily II DNA or RNA helicase